MERTGPDPLAYYCSRCDTNWSTPQDDGMCPQCKGVYIGGMWYRILNASLLEKVGFCAACYALFLFAKWLI